MAAGKECVRIFGVLLVSCLLIPRSSQDTRQKRDTSTLQPRIVTQDGHLVFETGTYRNITFKANEGGYIVLGGEDIKTIAETVRQNKQFLETLRPATARGSLDDRLRSIEETLDNEKTTIDTRLDTLANTLASLTTRVQALETPETLPTPTGATPPESANRDSSRRLRTLQRQVRTIQSQVRRLTTLLSSNECSSSPCRNGGTCIDQFNSFFCRCPSAWQGETCEIDVNECSLYAGTDLGCQNSAVCVNSRGSFRCECTANWHGVRCTESHDDCTGASNDALCVHGTCVNLPRVTAGQTKYRCVCNEGWTTEGARPACTVDVDECSARKHPCSVNPFVECINVPGTFYCAQCPPGYSGNGHICQDINECLTNNGGCSRAPFVTCTNTLGSRQCGACPAGYHGDGVTCRYVGICHIDNGGCHPNAQCTETPGIIGRACNCRPGYGGNGEGMNGCVPQGPVTGPCTSNPCGHGNCKVSGASYMCECQPGWTGRNCSELLDVCASTPCQNGGTCRFNSGGFSCECTDQFTGFTCDQPQERCGGPLLGTSGVIRYPQEEGETYPHSRDCAWVITTSPSKVISLSFTRLSLEPSHQCVYDFLEIHDGAQASSHMIAKLCQLNLATNDTITSTHNQLYIWFHSDATVNSDGFHVVWTANDPVCGGNLNAQDHGVITSPGYPGVYPHNRDCVWTVAVSPGKIILFTFGHLAIEAHVNCSYDYLKIQDGMLEDDPVLQMYCERQDPPPLRTTGPYALVTFHSDRGNNDRGFHVTYAAIEGIRGCGASLNAPEGVVISPNYPNPYQGDVQCVWVITVKESEKITLTFTNIDLEAQRSCSWDYVQLRDGSSETANIVGRFCGTRVPAPFTSNTNSLWLKLRTDTTNHGSGFRATWKVACGGILRGTSGVIKSPYFPEAYPHSHECVYDIQQPAGTPIVVTFVAFNISRTGGSCNANYLQVRDDPERVCGSSLPQHIITHSSLKLTFVTDGSTSNHGFHLTFSTGRDARSDDSKGAVEEQKACGGTLNGDTGSFATPNHPNTYPDGMNCTWYIVAEPGNLIRLTFNTFNLESHRACNYDHVSIYNNLTTNSLVGRYCGNMPPPVVTSSDNVLMVKFVSDSSLSAEGFSASFITLNASSACGSDLTDPVGFIRSPGYPNNYPNSRICIWHITMETGKQILLNVSDFAMEQRYPSCLNDYLEVRDGSFEDSPLIGRYCDRTIDPIIRSHSNRLYLKMQTDDSTVYRGFSIYYDATMSGCGGVMTNPTGSFVSPNYPYPYPHSVECFWTISAALGNIIELEFLDLQMESHMTCEYDYLQIREQNANGLLRAQYCGMETPQPLVSTTNKLYFKFRSDASNSAAGFHARYVTRCTNHVKSYSGVIESPNFMKGYPSTQNCTWVIETTQGNALNISFSHFSIETSTDCTYDYLELRDGLNQTSPLIGRFCYESQLPAPITTNSNALYVHFVTDDSVAAYGFRLEYITFGCGNVFQTPTGRFSSPGYPHPYPTPRECAWMISVPMGSSIVMTIEDLDLEQHSTCDLQSLEIYGGPDDTSPRLTQLCHTQTTQQYVTSTGNHMYVRFRTKGSLSARGFQVSYKTISGGCGGNFTARSGVITSKNYPNSYPHSTDCGWLITVEKGHVVTLTFDDLDVEANNGCSFDYVAVYDGNSTEAQQLGKLCGDTLPTVRVMRSTTNQMYIRMRSDQSVVARGFKASYETGCGGVVDASKGGDITSPGWPGVYGKDLTCVWHIRAAQPDQKVSLTLTHIDMPTRGLCVDDSLYVINGDDVEVTGEEPYCGSHIPATITSLGSRMVVIFHSDNQTEGTGFRATYTSSVSACGGDFTAHNGDFNSPSYPDSYSINIECVWTIRSSPGNLISLSFSAFSVENEKHCNKDYVEVRRDGAGGALLGRFCGNRIPPLVTNANLWVKFKSDEDTPGIGFRASYITVCGGDITLSGDGSGQLASPLYPNTYPARVQCVWIITVDVDKVIEVRFKNMMILSDLTSYLCGDHFVMLGASDPSADTNRFCGMEIPPVFVSSSNRLRVWFHAGSHQSSGTNQGFLLTYRAKPLALPTSQPTEETESAAVSCSGDLVAGEGATLISPGYPWGYDKKLLCKWKITAPPNHKVWFNLTSINLEGHSECLYDSVEVFSGDLLADPVSLGTYCGSHLNEEPLVSVGDLMSVRFVSDTSVNGTGFSAEYKSVCGGQIKGLTTGALESPQFPANYPHNTNCTWTILARPGRTISVTFATFNIIGESSRCEGDYLELFNGESVNSPSLGRGRYCGATIPTVPESSSNRLTVSFLSDSAHAAAGFKLVFRENSISCGGRLTLTEYMKEGYITSPNYPQPYPHNVDCVWMITAPGHNAVQLDFVGEFGIEGSQRVSCRYDFVEVRDGGTANSLLLGHYCGSILPSSVVSLGHILYVRFRTDSSVPKIGFRAKYSIATCGGSVFATNGSISSPNFPANYDNNMDCEWYIKGPTGHYLTIEFNSFSLQVGNCSMHDFVEVRDYNATGDVLGQFCGTNTRTMTTSDSYAFIRFHSDERVTTKGFRMTFFSSVQGCGGELLTPTGVISSPNYPGQYAHRRLCFWIIRVAEERRVTLTFDDFDLEPHALCRYDFVTVYNGLLVEDLSPVLGPRLCGTDNPGTFESSGNTMTVVFNTDGSRSARGFSAHYHSLYERQCGGRIMLGDIAMGTIESPDFGSNEYNHSIECIWILSTPPNQQASISLHFLNMSLEYTTSCQYDFVEVREGDTNAGEFMARYCNADTLPAVIISPSGHLWIRFVSDHSVAGGGFQLQYTLNKCGGVLSLPSGVITSPSENSHYDCEWHIMAESGQQIKLHFTNINLGTEHCEDSYVDVLNGGFMTSPSIGRFCGSTLPGDILSQSSQLRVIFHNIVRSSPARMFSLQFTTQAAGCGGVIHAQQGTVTSPNHPGLYPYSIECQWTINILPGYHILLTFVAPFDLEIDDGCTHDSLQIIESNQLAQTYCGNEMPPGYISSSNSITLVFESDAQYRGTGFAVNFTVGCGATYVTPQGTIISPGFPQRYSNNLRCVYKIVAKNDNDHIMLNFGQNTFHLEGSDRTKSITPSQTSTTTPAPDMTTHPSLYPLSPAQQHRGNRIAHHSGEIVCRYDFVEVYNGNISTDNSQGQFCGSTAPQEIWAIGTMYIVFETDSSLTDHGWMASYKIEAGGRDLTEPYGTFQTHTSKDIYHHKTNNTWTITVDPIYSISLKFAKFDIEASTRCNYDYVDVYDGLDMNSSPLIGRYCGSIPPDQIVSTGNTLLVNFVTDESVAMGGFTAIYRSVFGPTQGCGGLFNMTTGVIRSLDHSGNGQYEPDLSCTWHIIVPPDHNVRLRFDQFDLAPQGGTECVDRFDYLEVRDGFYDEDPVLGIYCGDTKPTDIVSSYNSLSLKFVSDESHQRAGFQVHFDGIENECGGTLRVNTEPQNLTSVGYTSGKNYGNNLRCNWILDAPITDQIRVQVTEIDVVEDPECSSDYIRVQDFRMTSTGRSLHYCGRVVPAEFISVGHLVQVSFVTDSERTGRGFFLTYETAGCNRTFSGESGHIRSPGWPGFYPDNANCDIIVSGPVGSSVALFFNTFEIETHSSCNFDFLQVHNGTGDDAVVMATLCGRVVPNPIFVTSSTVWMKFMSDPSLHGRGFDITYIASVHGCGGTLHTDSGSFTSPGYPWNQPDAKRCEWTIHSGARRQVAINFTAFHIGERDTCEHNYVSVYDGDSAIAPLVGTYCGNDNPAPLLSHYHSLFVVYTSTVNNTGTGFRLTFSAS